MTENNEGNKLARQKRFQGSNTFVLKSVTLKARDRLWRQVTDNISDRLTFDLVTSQLSFVSQVALNETLFQPMITPPPNNRFLKPRGGFLVGGPVPTLCFIVAIHSSHWRQRLLREVMNITWKWRCYSKVDCSIRLFSTFPEVQINLGFYLSSFWKPQTQGPVLLKLTSVCLTIIFLRVNRSLNFQSTLLCLRWHQSNEFQVRHKNVEDSSVGLVESPNIPFTGVLMWKGHAYIFSSNVLFYTYVWCIWGYISWLSTPIITHSLREKTNKGRLFIATANDSLAVICRL